MFEGCAGPVKLSDDLAAGQGLQRSAIQGTDFSHVIYSRADGRGSVWHVYIEGDGKPWWGRYIVAPDPTSDKPLMLRLMQQDAAPQLYLGRPCYLGMVTDPACKPWIWTHGRYSDQVVSSMRAALERLIEKHGIDDLVLIGHSGGGTLAMLLAERIAQTRMIITLAGNLDTKAWTERHDYSPLLGSLNPAERPPLSPQIRQFHFAGAQDRNLPATGSDVIIVDGVGHVRGWEAIYCEILKATGGTCRN